MLGARASQGSASPAGERAATAGAAWPTSGARVDATTGYAVAPMHACVILTENARDEEEAGGEASSRVNTEVADR